MRFMSSLMKLQVHQRVRARSGALLVMLTMTLFVNAAHATWSIIIVDTRTCEVAIGSATCLTGYDLQQLTPVMLVGVGGACAQSYVDTTGRNRILIRDELLNGTPPDQILQLLSQSDPGHQTRQYGIVDTMGGSATFTGNRAGAWAGGLVGQVGDLVYAIQGNVITGEPVILEAEDAILNTPGGLAEKLMASMEAAYEMGGDGRCSCSPSNPPGCGSPPASFTKSAHIGFMLLARLGDTDGICAASGCATGDYYMSHNVRFTVSSDPDPVLQLREMFDQWRLDLVGRPDAVESSVAFAQPVLRPTGGESTEMTITLRDWQGGPVTVPISSVTVQHEPGSDQVTQIGPVRDLGNGQYAVTITADWREGTDQYQVDVDDGVRPVRIIPLPSMTVQTAPGTIHLEDPVPGTFGAVNTLCVTNGTPGNTAVFAYSLRDGTTNTVCGPIGLGRPQVVGQREIQPDGTACISGFVPSPGPPITIRLQCVEVQTCARTNVVTWSNQ